MTGARVAHYVASTHWDREWYEPFQGFRMRLVSLLDEVLTLLEQDQTFASFTMDGQVLPLHDYLEVRPERLGMLRHLIAQGRIIPGPWYVLPDEWLVGGESLVRNLQFGMAASEALGGPTSRAGIVADQFGHTGQLPQLFVQLGLIGALVWRGTHEREHHGHFWWQAPDGSRLPTYRFGQNGYGTYAHQVRQAGKPETPFILEETVDLLVAHTLREADRSSLRTILLFDGGDHLEIESRTSLLLARANEHLAAHGVHIVQSTLDAYLRDVATEAGAITATVTGELRESGRPPIEEDEQWLIPGVLSSRIHLKQRNARCEDELCLWAEPWSQFATALGREYPTGYLRIAWTHLLQNHPHDSICGCSIDQVHQDMIYRFDQSLGIGTRLTGQALSAIARAAVPQVRPAGSLTITVFNTTAATLDEPIDLAIPLPTDWPHRYQEFFGYEEKFGLGLRGADGGAIPYQLVGQRRDQPSFRRESRKFPQPETHHTVEVTARVSIPSFGYTTLLVEPVPGPTRYLGSLSPAHDTIETETLRVQVNANGTIKLTDKRTGTTFDQLLIFEQQADIGDGWYHGIAVNDRVHTSTACSADLALIADGIGKATLRIALTMHVPEAFDFRSMTRCERLSPLSITSDVTLRQGTDRVEVTTTVENTVRDHRLRVLFPSNLPGDVYWSDAAYDVVERPVALAADNALRRELDVETRPQLTWTAFGDGTRGLAIVSRGLPESAVRDTAERPIALTLLRAFRRAVLSGDNEGGQVQGTHTFRYDVVPYAGGPPLQELFVRGQRINDPVRAVVLTPAELAATDRRGPLPPKHSFLQISGNVVVTSIQQHEGGMLVRLFNPHPTPERAILAPAGGRAPRSVTIDGRGDVTVAPIATPAGVEIVVPPKRIVTMLV